MPSLNTFIFNCGQAVTQKGKGPRQLGLRGILGLLLSILAVALFMFVLGPRLGDVVPMHKAMSQFIEDNNIEANMYFYTEVEEFSEAQVNMMNTREHPPRPLHSQLE